MSEQREQLTGTETVLNDRTGLQDATVLDFWQWAFSDLRANDVRGILAEWLVAKLLGLDLGVRDSWAAWDLRTPEGVTIEVKTSAYCQTWNQRRPSKIVFSGLRAKTWTPEDGYSDHADYNADLYVFCVHAERDPSRWNALDLDQWRFYLLPREALLALGYKSLSLGTLSSMTPELTAREFRERAFAAIQSALRSRSGSVPEIPPG